MFSETELNTIVKKITDNYQNEELFYVKPGHQMPNRDTIIHIILGMRQIMFPGYFDEERLSRKHPGFFLGRIRQGGQIGSAHLSLHHCRMCSSF